jgi:hypothetical protein
MGRFHSLKAGVAFAFANGSAIADYDSKWLPNNKVLSPKRAPP